MLIIDRTQRTWATLSAVVCVVAGGVYFAYANWSANGPSGGSVPGLIFGLIAAAMMVFAGLLAARRRFPAARIGSAQFWMKGHLWIGTLTVPFALFHAGFGLGGRVEILLWILFFAVILSGFWGLLLQQLLPRMMFENLPRETFIEQIPHLCNRFTAESDCQLAEVCGPLEVSLTPVELKRLESYWQPFFEEDRKKNRGDYPKTASDAVHFQKFLTKVYVGLPTSANMIATDTPVAAASVAPPALKSVAQIKAPETAAPAPVSADVAAVKSKPDPKALLAAAKAKAAAAPPPTDASAPESTPTPTDPVAAPGKPDPRAMLAAAKAKKALEAAEPGSNAISEPPAPTESAVAAEASPAKPDPKALLAAARAKKAAAEAALTPLDAPTVPAADVPVAVTPAKPDPRAMLAAAKAKKAQEAAAGTPADVPVEAAPPASSETNSASAKPDPKAMLAAAKAKRDAAAAEGVPSSPVAEPSTPAVLPPPGEPAGAGKPDPQAMLAALKAKKEAAAQQGATPAAAPAVKANPLAQLKAVKQPPAEAPPDLVAAAKVAPPTPTQLQELKLFYLELIRPQLPWQPATQSWREAIRRSIMVCQIRSDNQHPQFLRIFDDLLDLCEQRRQFAMIQRYHFWLHGWLLVHIPVTVALYVVLAVHAVMALRVIPFGN